MGLPSRAASWGLLGLQGWDQISSQGPGGACGAGQSAWGPLDVWGHWVHAEVGTVHPLTKLQRCWGHVAHLCY